MKKPIGANPRHQSVHSSGAERPFPAANTSPRGDVSDAPNELELAARQAVRDHDQQLGKALKKVERYEYIALQLVYAFAVTLDAESRDRFLSGNDIIESRRYKFAMSPIVNAFYKTAEHVERTQRTRYGKALTFAAVRRTPCDQFIAFIKQHGGFKGIDKLSRSEITGARDSQTDRQLADARRQRAAIDAYMGNAKTPPIEAPELTRGRAPGPCVFVGEITEGGRILLHRIPDMDEAATTRFILRQVQS
jgi:hypothetical protein